MSLNESSVAVGQTVTPPRDGPARVAVLIVTAVWGEWHIQQLLELNLATLLADGNLPNFVRRHTVSYRIFTRVADLEMLADSDTIKHLGSLMPIEFLTLADDILKNPIAAHHHAWDEATRAAKADDSFVLYLPPDVAWSERSFTHLADLLADGRQAIFMTYLRAESRSFTTAIQALRPAGSLALSVSGPDLVALTLKSLHPLMAASLATSPRFPRHSEMLFWPVPGEGLLLRVLAREMFLFNPRYLSLNAANLVGSEIDPDAVHFVSDSDEFFAVSLAGLGKDVDWHMKLRPADPVEIGRWWLNYDSPVNDAIASYKIRWHVNPVTEAKWRQREVASDLFIRRCGVIREGLRVREAAQELGCSKAAQLIAFAVHCHVLEHVVRGSGAATILVPVNAAFAQLPDGFVDRLLTPAGRKDLIRFLRAHITIALPPKNPMARRLGTTPIKLRGRGAARVVGQPVAVGRHTVQLVSQCLTAAL